LRLFSFGGSGLALAALALVDFGAYDSYPEKIFYAVISDPFLKRSTPTGMMQTWSGANF